MAAMYVLVAPLFSLGSAFFTKTSIIIAFMRIMGRTVTWVHKLIAYIPIFLLLVVTIMCASIMIFFCWPVQKSWRPYLPGTCADPKLLDIFGRTGSGMSILLDFWIIQADFTDRNSVQCLYGHLLCCRAYCSNSEPQYRPQRETQSDVSDGRQCIVRDSYLSNADLSF